MKQFATINEHGEIQTFAVKVNPNKEAAGMTAYHWVVNHMDMSKNWTIYPNDHGQFTNFSL